MIKSERQQRIKEIISHRRHETVINLATELGVSRYTIMRDLDEITDSASFYTVRGRHGAGVYAVDGWYYSKTYLSEKQSALLVSLLPSLSPTEKSVMQSILDAFAKPAV